MFLFNTLILSLLVCGYFISYCVTVTYSEITGFGYI